MSQAQGAGMAGAVAAALMQEAAAGWHSEWCAAGGSQRTPPVAPDACAWGLAQGVFRQSHVRPHALAISSPSGQWSYLQLARQSCGLAAHWQSLPAWPAPGGSAPRVGILASRSAEACMAALAASWAGTTYVPIGLKLPPERIEYILSHCQLSALVADAQGARLLSEQLLRAAPADVQVLGCRPPEGPAADRVLWLPAHELAAAPLQPPRAMGPDDAAYILFTSGTTGAPKGVVVPMRAVRHYVPTMAAYLGLHSRDRVLDLFELGFDVSVHNMFCTWEAGASLHLLPPAQVMNAVRFVREQGLTVWSSVPSLVGLLDQVKALGPGAMPTLRLSSFGGEPLSRGVVQAWQEAAPKSAIFNLYGPTEATVTCLAQRIEVPWPSLHGSDVMAIGQALPGCEVDVLDERGRPVPEGQPGELAVAGVQLASGYLDAPELTASRFIRRGGQRWYLTGDLALRDELGRLHCLGRLDHQVKVRGHRIELEDVEVHLREVSGATLVAAVPWPLSGGAAQGLVAFASGAAWDEAAVLRSLRSRLPPYMVPARLLSLAQMPTNANGKVDRRALSRLLEAGLTL